MSELTQQLYANIKHKIAAKRKEKRHDTKFSRLGNQFFGQGMQPLQTIQTFLYEKRFLIIGTLLSVSIGSALIIHNTFQANGTYQVFINGKYVGMAKNRQEASAALASLGRNDNWKVKLTPVALADPKQFQPIDGKRLAAAGIAPVTIQINNQNIVNVANSQAAEDVLKAVEQFYLRNQPKNSRVSINDAIRFIPYLGTAGTVKSVSDAVHQVLGGADSPQTYVVSRGDTLWDIAKRTDTTVDKLVSSNPVLSNINNLQLGEKLVVSTKDPYVHVTVDQTVTKDVTVPYTTRYIDDDAMATGDTKVITEGQNGLETQTLHIVTVNGKVVKQDILARTVKQQMVQAVVKRGTNSGIASGDYIWPISSHLITSPYGENRGYEFHPGVDIGAPTGTPIWASNNGTVIDAGWNNGGYGNWVEIDHGNGVVSIYGHMSRIDVQVGQRVTKGQTIGAVGMTGEATGPHLHYEVRVNGVRVNPAPYM
ncbi:peptidoglycan DD-metalloendopeptidase family protein [Fodinisporobacter ferrooxydans]|uniref:Peptidoglycan DD-metalloendopeptidase family protein n=1 Tax=Fodinisporobacter ferrooxydans TaxID=2901836 RepID=A0ABY4CLG3_9BACL|nr:peptidoglycan DD-metalloendopeptidase family protein [Alicyclobacillaceae bacterium MYW30-H2]